MSLDNNNGGGSPIVSQFVHEGLQGNRGGERERRGRFIAENGGD